MWLVNASTSWSRILTHSHQHFWTSELFVFTCMCRVLCSPPPPWRYFPQWVKMGSLLQVSHGKSFHCTWKYARKSEVQQIIWLGVKVVLSFKDSSCCIAWCVYCFWCQNTGEKTGYIDISFGFTWWHSLALYFGNKFSGVFYIIWVFPRRWTDIVPRCSVIKCITGLIMLTMSLSGTPSFLYFWPYIYVVRQPMGSVYSRES